VLTVVDRRVMWHPVGGAGGVRPRYDCSLIDSTLTRCYPSGGHPSVVGIGGHRRPESACDWRSVYAPL
jgi:hypothetical protein